MFLVDPDVTIKWVVRLEPHQRLEASRAGRPKRTRHLSVLASEASRNTRESSRVPKQGLWQDVAGKSFHIIGENRDVSLLQLPIIATWSLLYIDLELVIQPQAR